MTFTAGIDHCGQRGITGRYCAHFHLLKQCPECRLRGLAIENGFESGITVHGTHRAKVDDNVLWNIHEFGIYVEDGNEMNNTIASNVAICPGINCSGKSTGLYIFSPTNNFLRNRARCGVPVRHVLVITHALVGTSDLCGLARSPGSKAL
eukprot:TRINITY_DN12266_c0_g2_i10.p2 TRINITY_DN12266_c0_g2~~TRINITY_DN12266_c0_g2_i10.p2  ORF type:complete len:150 (+),score=11.07 TRINITY_DN12266_c0_g2_i10:1963-2412(+)